MISSRTTRKNREASLTGWPASSRYECPTWRLRASRPTCSQIRRFKASSQGPSGIPATWASPKRLHVRHQLDEPEPTPQSGVEQSD